MRKLILFLLLTLTAAAQTREREERAMAWIQAYNSGKAETLEAFAQSSYAPGLLERRSADERRQMYTQLWERHGRLEVVDVRLRNGEVRIGVRPERGEPLQLTFGFEPAPPHRISMLGIDVGEGQDDGPPLPPFHARASVGRETYVKALDEYLRKLDGFSGAVLVAKGDEIWFEKAYGFASQRFKVPNTIRTRFDVGSNSKDFTKVAIAQLAQAGKLKLTDTIGTHLPDYPNKDVRDRITIEQLVRHTSGLGDVFTPEYFNASRLKFRSIGDYIPIFADDPLRFEPGTSQRYSNYGYIVLGAIIEAVSGESYYDYVQRHVFDPAGMKSSGFFEADRIVPDVAIGHTKILPGGRPGTELRENVLRLPVRGASDGGSHSTVRDLFLFDRALRQHKLADATWSRWVLGDTASVALAGGAPGLNCLLQSDGDWAVVVLTNIDPPSAEALGTRVLWPSLH